MPTPQPDPVVERVLGLIDRILTVAESVLRSRPGRPLLLSDEDAEFDERPFGAERTAESLAQLVPTVAKLCVKRHHASKDRRVRVGMSVWNKNGRNLALEKRPNDSWTFVGTVTAVDKDSCDVQLGT